MLGQESTLAVVRHVFAAQISAQQQCYIRTQGHLDVVSCLKADLRCLGGCVPHAAQLTAVQNSVRVGRLEDALMAVMQRGDPEVLTPDLKDGRGNTKSFTSAVIKAFYE